MEKQMARSKEIDPPPLVRLLSIQFFFVHPLFFCPLAVVVSVAQGQFFDRLLCEGTMKDGRGGI